MSYLFAFLPVLLILVIAGVLHIVFVQTKWSDFPDATLYRVRYRATWRKRRKPKPTLN